MKIKTWFQSPWSVFKWKFSHCYVTWLFFFLWLFLWLIGDKIFRSVIYGGPYLQTQQAILETQHNSFETQVNICKTQHKVIEAQHKITETQNKIIETQYKIIETTLSPLFA